MHDLSKDMFSLMTGFNDANDEAAQHAAAEIFRKIFGLWDEISDGIESESVFKSEDMLRVDEMYVSNSEQQSRTSRHWNIKTENMYMESNGRVHKQKGKKDNVVKDIM